MESQVVVDRADGRRTFADGGCDAFGGSGADIADGEQSRMTGFERQRGASERFPGSVLLLASEGSIREHKPSVVKGGEA